MSAAPKRITTNAIMFNSLPMLFSRHRTILRWTSASWLIELFFDLREDAFKSNTIAIFVWDYNILPVIKDRRRTKGAAPGAIA